MHLVTGNQFPNDLLQPFCYKFGHYVIDTANKTYRSEVSYFHSPNLLRNQRGVSGVTESHHIALLVEVIDCPQDIWCYELPRLLEGIRCEVGKGSMEMWGRDP